MGNCFSLNGDTGKASRGKAATKMFSGPGQLGRNGSSKKFPGQGRSLATGAQPASPSPAAAAPLAGAGAEHKDMSVDLGLSLGGTQASTNYTPTPNPMAFREGGRTLGAASLASHSSPAYSDGQRHEGSAPLNPKEAAAQAALLRNAKKTIQNKKRPLKSS